MSQSKYVNGAKVIRVPGGARTVRASTIRAEDFDLKQKQEDKRREDNETWTESNGRQIRACKGTFRRR